MVYRELQTKEDHHRTDGAKARNFSVNGFPKLPLRIHQRLSAGNPIK
jgi:hypothetical protein